MPPNLIDPKSTEPDFASTMGHRPEPAWRFWDHEAGLTYAILVCVLLFALIPWAMP